MKKAFDWLNSLIRGAEGSLVNLISSIAPWGAPSPVAYMTYDHCLNTLHFPGEIALITALVVEALGISSISTALSFWSHNKKYTDKKDQAPLIIAVLTFGFYILLVLSLNVVVDVEKMAVDKTITNGIIFARALLTLLSIPAGVLLATRAQQTEILNALETSEKVFTNQSQIDLQKAEQQAAQDRADALAKEERDRAAERQRWLDERENERLVLEAQALERERLAKIEADLKAKKAAIRKGIWKDSPTKVSESFDNSADESLSYANFPRNWRKMSVEHKQELARLISDNAKEDVAKTLNVSVRTVENWIVGLTSEGYLQ